MTRLGNFVLGTSFFLAMTAPALASSPVPAPILGAGLPALGLLGLAGGGYLFLKWRRRRN